MSRSQAVRILGVRVLELRTELKVSDVGDGISVA